MHLRGTHYINEYAYPLNTLDKSAVMKRFLYYAKTKGVYDLGRQGEHEHYSPIT